MLLLQQGDMEPVKININALGLYVLACEAGTWKYNDLWGGGGEDRGIQTSRLPYFVFPAPALFLGYPNIKIQILICCPYTFPIVVVERRSWKVG